MLGHTLIILGILFHPDLATAESAEPGVEMHRSVRAEMRPLAAIARTTGERAEAHENHLKASKGGRPLHPPRQTRACDLRQRSDQFSHPNSCRKGRHCRSCRPRIRGLDRHQTGRTAGRELGRARTDVFDSITGTRYIGFKGPDGAKDYLNPRTGRIFYGHINGRKTQDLFDPRGGRWLWGFANRNGSTDYLDPLTGQWLWGIPKKRP